MRLKIKEGILDPGMVKTIIVSAEDTRIATRLSELSSEIDDQELLERRTRAVKNLWLNLISGQQCVRDFFLCLQENILSWPDVCAPLSFDITHSTTCLSCNHVHQFQTNQMYVEIPVPPNHTNLNDYIEEHLNTSSLFGKFCDGCKQFSEAEKSSKITLANETEYLMIILSRALETLDGFKFIDNEINVTNEVFIR